MIKDITIGQYIPGDSLLHRADPRVKIMATIIFMVLVFIVNTYWQFITVSLFTLLVIIGAGIPLRYTVKGLKPILFILVFMTIINILTIKGTPLLDLGIFTISRESVDLSIKTAFRLTLLVMGASLLTLTTTPIVLTDGIEKLMAPLKVVRFPVHEIAMMMTIALRFIPTLMEETDKIIKAQSARGADFDSGNLLQRAKSFIPVLVPLFVSAFKRADELATAMEARCYRGSEGRTRMKQLRLTRADLVVSLILLAFCGGMVYLRYRA